MKTNKLIYIFFIFVFYRCDTENSASTKTEQPLFDTISHSDTTKAQATNSFQFQPYTKNPIFLTDNKIYIDSLLKYFKYKDITRLDHIYNTSIDSLNEIVFSNKKIKVPSKLDTIFLSDYQFIIGNIKTSSENSIIAIVDYYEGWGQEIILLTIDKFHNIIDIQSISASCADGADFYRADVKYINSNTYEYVSENGYSSLTEPIDTTKYKRITRKIKIRIDGTFENNLVKIDSNLVELHKSRR